MGMSKRLVDEQHAKEALKELINNRDPDTPAKKVLPIFCHRYGLTMEACRAIYNELIAEGEIKEKPL